MMTRVRFAARHAGLGMVLLAVTILPVWAQPPAPQLPPEPAKGQDAASRRAAEQYYLPPVSRVGGYAGDVYSRGVNRVVCAADALTGPGGTTETWLGTRLGIKRVRKETGVVRHYSLRDGLPGDWVEDIVVDARGAAAFVRQPDRTTAVCWWDAATDRWRTLARLPYGDAADKRRWRFVLTPTRLIVAPPQFGEPSGIPIEESKDLRLLGFTVWRRDGLQAGRDTRYRVDWDRTLRETDRAGGQVVTGLCAVGETVWVGGGMGVLCLPPASLADRSAPTGTGTAFVPATPRMPRFLDDVVVTNLVADGDSVWALISHNTPWETNKPEGYNLPHNPRRELVRLTPELTGDALAGVRQSAQPVPIVPFIIEEPFDNDNLQLVATINGPWIVTDSGFLHRTGDTWERRDRNGAIVPLEEPKRLSRFIVAPPAFYSETVPATPLLAPPASAVPDAVAQARVTASNGPPLGDIDTLARRTAWIRQRFPFYFSPPATIPPTAPVSTTDAQLLQSSLDPGGSIRLFVTDPQLPGTAWTTDTLPGRHTDYTDHFALSGPPLRQLSLATPPVLRWEFAAGRFIPTATDFPTADKAIALPALPIRLHLNVRRLLPAADGLQVETDRGTLRLPRATLAGPGPDFAAGAQWVRQTPLRRQTAPRSYWDVPRVVTPRPTPFGEADSMPVGTVGGRQWFIGRIVPPKQPRYPRGQSAYRTYYALAGYDPIRRAWTRPLELPENHDKRRQSVIVQNGTIYTAFHASDAGVWQFVPARNDWQPIAPPLPAVPGKASGGLVPFLWTAQNGDLWLLANRGVYHRAPKARRWDYYSAPPLFDQFLQEHVRDGDYPQLSMQGNGLLFAWRNGLWRFDRTRHTWGEIAPLVSELKNTSVELLIRSLAADHTAVYLTGVPHGGPSRPDGFVLQYDKKGHWQSLTAETLGLTRLDGSERVWFDGQAVWITTYRQTVRRDPATGKWHRIGSPYGPGYQQIVPVPAMPGSVYLLHAAWLQRYYGATGQVRTLAVPQVTLESAVVGPLPRLTRIFGAAPYGGDLLLNTSAGLYRVSTQTGTFERLLLPALDYALSADDTHSPLPGQSGDATVWDRDTLIYLPAPPQ